MKWKRILKRSALVVLVLLFAWFQIRLLDFHQRLRDAAFLPEVNA